MTEPLAYEPGTIEARWRERWRATELSCQPTPSNGRNTYIVSICPSPAGQLHMRQVRVYTFADTLARFRRSRGDAVLFSIGFDAFTLFVEMAAIRSGIDPRKLSGRAQKQIRAQLERLGFSFDWSRSFVTCDEDMYRWSQWLFLRLLDRGLVYRMDAPTAWCDHCETALASIQIVDGCCWHCEHPVRTVERPQWFVQLGRYLADLDQAIDGLSGWDAEQKLQRALLGKTAGVEVELRTADGCSITAFTPYPDAIGGACFVAIAPDHPAVTGCSTEVREAVRAAVASVERRADTLPVIPTGSQVSLPGSPRVLPVIVSPMVNHRVGGGALLGIPGRDATDAVIARRLALDAPDPTATPPEVVARPAVRYRTRDFPISREHFWGTPIPLVHCPSCGIVPVPEAELPVVLPPDLLPAERGNPLANHPSFSACACPRCGGAARRDPGTLDGHTDNLWFWLAPCVPPADRRTSLFDHPELARWLPVEQVIWTEGRSEGLMDIRFVTRVLRDLGHLGHVEGGEPFHHVLVTGPMHIDESKAQDSLGDVADPGELLRRFGADALRFSLLHAVAPRKDLTWTGASLMPCHRFLQDVWEFTVARLGDLRVGELPSHPAPADRRGQRLRVWCETALAKITENLETMNFHRATRNAMMLFERIQQFDAEARNGRAELPAPAQAPLAAAVATLLHVLAPMTPHLAEELWERCGGRAMLACAPWPSPPRSSDGAA